MSDSDSDESLLVTKAQNYKGVTCLCGNHKCSKLTKAFSARSDVRKRLVKLPSCTERQRRGSYLRHLLPNDESLSDTESHYIALHHFHPSLISQDGTLPKTISMGHAIKLRTILDTNDRTVDEYGMPAFLVVPNYPLASVEMDVNDANNILVEKVEIPKRIRIPPKDADSDTSSIGVDDWEMNETLEKEESGTSRPYANTVSTVNPTPPTSRDDSTMTASDGLEIK